MSGGHGEGAPAGAGAGHDRGGFGDLVAGGLAAAFGTAVLLHLRGFPGLPGGAPGPALFPGVVGGLFVVFGLALVGQWLKRRRAAPPPRQPAARPRPAAACRARLNALAVLGSVVFYLAVVDVAGFSPTMAVLLFVLMRTCGARTAVAAPAAAAATLVMVLLFRELLLVPLPTPSLG